MVAIKTVSFNITKGIRWYYKSYIFPTGLTFNNTLSSFLPSMYLNLKSEVYIFLLVLQQILCCILQMQCFFISYQFLLASFSVLLFLLAWFPVLLFVVIVIVTDASVGICLSSSVRFGVLSYNFELQSDRYSAYTDLSTCTLLMSNSRVFQYHPPCTITSRGRPEDVSKRRPTDISTWSSM